MQRVGTKRSRRKRKHSSAYDSDADRAGDPPLSVYHTGSLLYESSQRNESSQNGAPIPRGSVGAVVARAAVSTLRSPSGSTQRTRSASPLPIPSPGRSNTRDWVPILTPSQDREDDSAVDERFQGQEAQASKVEHAPVTSIMGERLGLLPPRKLARLYPPWKSDLTGSSSRQPPWRVKRETASASSPCQPSMRVPEEEKEIVKEYVEEKDTRETMWQPSVLVNEEQPSPQGQAVPLEPKRLMEQPSATMRPPKHQKLESGRTWRTSYEEESIRDSKTIKLYTCGLQDLGCPKSRVWGTLRKRYDVGADFVLDATIFKKPKGRDYTGEHVAFMMEMCEDQRALETFFRSVQDSFRQDIENRCDGRKEGPITIAIFSDLGKHRSRAMARLLDYILYRLCRYTVNGPFHLSSGSCAKWDCPPRCQVCGRVGSAAAFFDRQFKRYIRVQKKIENKAHYVYR